MEKVQFYLNCPIGLEKLLRQEIQIKYPQMGEIILEKGGVSLETSIETGLYLNYYLKIPTRILLRIKTQKCRDLPKLFQILKKINWRKYLLQTNVGFSISASKSRLIHTSKIEATCKDALNAYFLANSIPGAILKDNLPDQKIYLRFFEDNLTISLDTSGELLHKRDKTSALGHARIRENYAAALVLFLTKGKVFENLSLVDPMCGTGTLLKEARSFFKVNDRSFAFENWREQGHTFQNHYESKFFFKEFLGNDIDENLNPDHDLYEFEQCDFFKNKFPKKCHVIFNPPYGKRIKLPTDGKTYFKNLVDHLKAQKNIERFGIIIPDEFIGGLKSSQKIRFNQNGIRVSFLVFNK